ncbi:unnamed protein product, partial [Iphiclides podalirius]
MEYSFRSIRIFSRLLRKPGGFVNHKYASNAAVKEEPNTELLTSFNQDTKAGGVVPVFRRALLFPTRIALQDDIGIYTYAGLHQAATTLSKEIAAQLLGDTERTIAYMCGNDASHVIVQWAIWMTGNIAVPLTSLHPPDMLKYFVTDSNASLVVCTQEYEKLLRPIAAEVSRPLLVTSRDKEVTAQLYQPNTSFMKPKIEEALSDVGKTNMWYGNSDAMLIYTSGTTSKPKGVVWSHSMLSTQIAALHSAWRYSANDVVLHTLPLHHIHGQLNSLNASLAAGARVRTLPAFVAHAVWSRLLGMGEREEARVSVVHGVPAMYARLVAAHGAMFAACARTAAHVRHALAARLRLACAGSAPLSDALARDWEEISGVRLLERYGMSEVGMALSNPYVPAEGRSPGFVGRPLPGVAARIATGEALEPLVTVETPPPDTQISLDRLGLGGCKDFFSGDDKEWKQSTVTFHRDSENGEYQGELLLKGPAVFSRYWNRTPQLNAAEFTRDGWFRTGDTASYSGGRFAILGRTSVDIIKASGYKVSALQVEAALMEHPAVADVAVLGVHARRLRRDGFCRDSPERQCQDQMPRNAMGKLDKKEIKRLYSERLQTESS